MTCKKILSKIRCGFFLHVIIVFSLQKQELWQQEKKNY